MKVMWLCPVNVFTMVMLRLVGWYILDMKSYIIIIFSESFVIDYIQVNEI